MLAGTLIGASCMWCVVGWVLVSTLSANGCHDDLVGETILGWTIVQIFFMMCAVCSRLVRLDKIAAHPNGVGSEEGSVQR